MGIKTVDQLTNIQNKKIFLRVDFNITGQDDFRIKEALPTIKFLLKKNSQIFLISHFKDPTKINDKFSLKQIIPLLKKYLPSFNFWPYYQTKKFLLTQQNFPSSTNLVLLENIRFFNDSNLNLNLAKLWAKNFDFYVNEAFSASHRQHISTYLISKFLPTFFGFHFKKEIDNLSVWRKKQPIVLILGGSKISTKYPLIKNFQKEKFVKKIILGGGLLNFFLKQSGFDIKKSFYEKDFKKKISSTKIMAPTKVVFHQNKIVDIDLKGLKEIFQFLDELDRKYNHRLIVIWNGPLGIVEKKESSLGTKKLAHYLISRKFFKIIGGGDTVAFLKKIKILSRFNYVSTGGGAMLWFLAYRSLPILKLVK